jgi:hypothetical protein
MLRSTFLAVKSASSESHRSLSCRQDGLQYRRTCLRTSPSTSSTLSFHIYIRAPCRSGYVSSSSSSSSFSTLASEDFGSILHDLTFTSTTDRMLQSSQQRAVSYPTFPGNVEALSIPSSSPEPLQESPPSSPPPTSMTATQHLKSSSNLGMLKHRQTLAAYRQFRKRKSKVRIPRPKPT